MNKQRINTVIKKSMVLSFFKLVWFKKKWRNKNKHNFTVANNCFNRNMVKVGNGTYGDLNVYHFGNPNEMLRIGNFCSIAPQVSFLLGGEHNYSSVSTFPFGAKYALNESFAPSKGPIIVCDDVWIGFGSVILSGVTLGQGAIVAAGSVVVKNVEPYSIVGGVPAKLITYRFSEEERKKLTKLNYSNINYSDIKKYLEVFEKKYENIDDYGFMLKQEIKEE